MSAKLLIIVVGVVLIGVSVLSSLSKNDSGKLIKAKLGIPLGILGVLMVIFGSYTSDVLYVSSHME